MPRAKKKIGATPVKKRDLGPSAEERDRIRRANEAKYQPMGEESGIAEDETNLRHSQPRKWLKQVAGIDAVTDGKVKEGITSAMIQGKDEREPEEKVDYAAERHVINRESPYAGFGSPNWLKHVERIKAKIRMTGKGYAKENAVGKGQADARRKVGNRAG